MHGWQLRQIFVNDLVDLSFRVKFEQINHSFLVGKYFFKFNNKVTWTKLIERAISRAPAGIQNGALCNNS